MRQQQPSSVVPQEFRRVLGHLPTGVTAVTAHGPEGPIGMVVNSVTSVSLDPPLLLICPAKSSSTWPALRAVGEFCVNVMAGHHEQVCRAFARPGADRFAGVAWHERAAGPGIEEAVAWIGCRVLQEHDAGDHTIVVAEVTDLEAASDVAPLVFFRGAYGTFTA
ncbi:flavin reductase family protein [Nocardia sp. BSTN01]|uniref:flavin reductase family protein n=1 Tax=Nocardia sp. BSTN01 TaxID=2783665 RepID=UPI001E5CE325|nr:flavin reductase family protein [Nocardia sp. BSTN01]